MKKIPALTMVCLLFFPYSNANAWWFFFLPGSVTGAISDAVTGSEGQNCVGPNAKVGDTVRMPGGGKGTIKSLSGTSIRCTNPEFPIRALLDFSSNPTQTILPEVVSPSSSDMMQGKLPVCLGSYSAETWTNCVGQVTFPDGGSYVGEWKDGKRNGQGNSYNPDGSIRASGIWQNDIFIEQKGQISGSENAAAAPDAPTRLPTVADPSVDLSPSVSRPSPALANPSPNNGSAAQRLRDLYDLYKDGVINKNDFEIKKKEILKAM